MASKSKISKVSVARFAPGQIVKHKQFGYKGLIFDVDAVFSQPPEWYEVMAKARPAKDAPWYHMLVDGETHTTYVAEGNLVEIEGADNIDHPLLELLFDHGRNGCFESRLVMN